MRIISWDFFQGYIGKVEAMTDSKEDSQRKPNLNLGKVQIKNMKHVTVQADSPPLTPDCNFFRPKKSFFVTPTLLPTYVKNIK